MQHVATPVHPELRTKVEKSKPSPARIKISTALQSQLIFRFCNSVVLAVQQLKTTNTSFCHTNFNREEMFIFTLLMLKIP